MSLLSSIRGARSLCLAACVLSGSLIATDAFANAEPLVESATSLQFARQRQVGSTDYTCLGVGVRKIFFFKVYAAAFCLENAAERSADLAAWAAEDADAFFERLLALEDNKLVVLKVVRDISSAQMAEAFSDSLEGILTPEQIALLIGTIPGDVASGEEVLLYSQGSTLHIDMAGGSRSIDDAAISRELWRVWLGNESATPSLRDNILDAIRSDLR